MSKSTVDIVRLLKYLENKTEEELVSLQIYSDGSYRILDKEGTILIDSDTYDTQEDVHDLCYVDKEEIAQICIQALNNAALD